MAAKSFWGCEREKLAKIGATQAPHSFKKIGIGILIFLFISLFFIKFLIADSDIDSSQLKIVFQYGILAALLMIVVAKEKIEDELVIKLRMQAYTLAFIFGVIYAIVLPFVDYGVDIFFTEKEPMLKELGNFQVLWMLLSVQIASFLLLKRLHSEKE